MTIVEEALHLRLLPVCSLFISLILAQAANAETALSIELKPWGAPVIHTFAEPPADLGAEYAADATARLKQFYRYEARPDINGYLYLKKFEFTLSGYTEIRLPQDADEYLHQHEHGHDALNRLQYERHLKKIDRTAIEQLVGVRFRTRHELEQAIAVAVGSAIGLERLELAMDTINQRYDSLTDHGRNPRIAAAQGIDQIASTPDRLQTAQADMVHDDMPGW